MNGHEIKLAGKTGELARSVIPRVERVTEADMVRRYLSNPRFFPSTHLK